MNNGDYFWDVLKLIFCFLFICLIVFIVYAYKNGTNTKKTTIPSYNYYQNRNNSVPQQTSPTNPQIQHLLEDDRNMQSSQPSTYQRKSQPTKTYSPTTDDAYEEGYENGYLQGICDGKLGYSYGDNYDDDLEYYETSYGEGNEYKTSYIEGYEEGYDDGYNDGILEYEFIPTPSNSQ